MSARQPLTAVDEALAHAKQGRFIFALPSNSKKPVPGSNGFKDATRDPATIKRMFSEPDQNIGWRMGPCGDFDIIAVDLDRKNGKDGVAEFERLAGEAGEAILPTLTAITPTEGRHLLYVNWSDNRISNSAGEIGPGIDIRGEDGYIVASGSTIDGRVYRFENPSARIEPCPKWLMARLKRAKPTAAKAKSVAVEGVNIENAIERGRQYLEGLEPATQGNRDDSAFKTAARIRDFGVGQADAQTLMAEHFQCVPMLDPPELAHAVDSAFTYARGIQGGAAAEAEFPVVPEPVGLPTGKPRFAVRMFADTKPNLDYNWLIKNLLSAGGLAALIAQPNELKTFVATDMSMAIARAFPWMGCKTMGGAVLYVSADGPLANRVEAYRKHYSLDGQSIPFATIEAGPNLHNNKLDVLGIIDASRDLATQTGQPVRLIVFDTLARVLAGGDENSGQDMGALLANVGKIQRETGSAVLLVHHLGKDDKRGARGHSSLLGAVDTCMEIKDGVLTVTKQREGERGARFGFRAHPVQIGLDLDGKPVTSCVVLPDNVSAAEEFAPISGGAVDALEILEDLCDTLGADNVTVEMWRARFIELKYRGLKSATSRKAFTRAMRDLKDRVTERGGHVSLL